jgi:hypothetical protein
MRTTWHGLGMALALAAGQAQAGMTYMAVNKAEGGPGAAMQNFTVQGWADKAKARVEFVESGNPTTPPGAYLLSKDGGATMYLVNPADKTYVTWDMPAMAGMLKLMNAKISEANVEKLADERGPKLLGHATRHYKFRTTYSAETQVLGMKNVSAVVLEDEIWAAPDLNEAGLGAWAKKQIVQTGDKDLDTFIKQQMDKIEGLQLKRITVNTSQDAQGGTRVSKATMEITELSEAAVPPDKFEIPADYQEKKEAAPAAPMRKKTNGFLQQTEE